MKAHEARALYFEDFIETEELVRKTVRCFSGATTKNWSQNNLIVAYSIPINNALKPIKISHKDLLSFKNVRNWLAHQGKSKVLPQKYEVICLNIKANNASIRSLLIAKNCK